MASPCSKAVAIGPTFRKISFRYKVQTLSRCLFLSCLRWGLDLRCTWWNKCNSVLICKMHLLCLIMSSIGRQWLATSLIAHTIRLWLFLSMICNQRMLLLRVCFGRTSMLLWQSIVSLIPSSRDKVLKQTRMLSRSYTVVVIPQFQWRTKRECASSTGYNPLKSIQKQIYVLTSRTNTNNSIGSIRMQLYILNPRFVILPFKDSDSPSGPL